MAKVVFGSVRQHVTAHADCPVVVVAELGYPRQLRRAHDHHPGRNRNTEVTPPQLPELSLGECLELLGGSHLGRLAFIDSVGVLPIIVPVNYLTHDGSVVFRAGPGAKLAAAVRGAPVVFEGDGVRVNANLVTGGRINVGDTAGLWGDPTR